MQKSFLVGNEEFGGNLGISLYNPITTVPIAGKVEGVSLMSVTERSCMEGIERSKSSEGHAAALKGRGRFVDAPTDSPSKCALSMCIIWCGRVNTAR